MATGRPPCQARMASSGGVADLLLHGLGQPAAVVVAHARGRAGRYGSSQPVRLAGELHEHHQQRRDVGDGDRLAELLHSSEDRAAAGAASDRGPPADQRPVDITWRRGGLARAGEPDDLAVLAVGRRDEAGAFGHRVPMRRGRGG